MNICVHVSAVLGLACCAMPAVADEFTSKIVAVTEQGVIVLADRSTVAPDAKQVQGKLEPGAIVTISFNGTENGFDPLYMVKVIAPAPVKPPV